MLGCVAMVFRSTFARAMGVVIPILGLGLAGGPAAGAEMEAVDLELALAIDVSGSIDDQEALLQREGYIAAFRHPKIIQAISGGYLRRIAVSYYEWAGFGHMKIIADWTVIHDTTSAHAFAEQLTLEPPQTARRTAISDAITFGVGFLEANRFDGTRRVLDISGDGPNNWGLLVTGARDAAVARGITINGLPIMNGRPSRFGSLPIDNLDLYYQNCVIGGPGAFLVVAEDFTDFAQAILRKLYLEIAGRAPPAPTTGHHPAGGRAAPPCDIGERRWDDIDDF
jgi:hypothetical protein